jgi:hypothetical protein
MAFKKIVTADKNLQLIQDNIQSAFNESLFFNGSLLTDVSVLTSQTTIKHGLGRVPKIWVICDQDENSVVWRSQESSNLNLYLTASSDCTVSLWVS